MGLFIVTLALLVAILGPWIAPFPADGMKAVTHLDVRLEAPSSSHPLGTDALGRDVLSRIMLGARISLGTAFGVVSMALVVGSLLGLWAGYAGGKVDEMLMRATDIAMSVPVLILAIVVVTAFGPGLFNTMLALAVLFWPSYARLARAEALWIREQAYVKAAHSLGVSRRRVILVHILPNSVTPLIVQASFDTGRAILLAASLGFLGLGAQPPAPEWGLMVAHGRNYISSSWWFSTFPGLSIMLVVLGFNLLGDGLRDIFDRKTGGT